MNLQRQSSRYAASLQHFANAVMTGDEGVEPYTRNYIGAHVLALENTYPAVQSLLGSMTFGALARVYALHYQAVQWDLNIYGEAFAVLLAAQVQGAKAANFDWNVLAGIAQIEYAITQAYYADETGAGISTPLLIDILSIPENTSAHCELQQQHSGVGIAEDLTLNQTVVVWREDLRVHVSNQPAFLARLDTGDA
jgi:hypothetical protein